MGEEHAQCEAKGNQGHGQQAVQHESDDGAQNAALCTESFGQGHQQSDIKPSNDDQVHLFSSCNLGDIKLKDTLFHRFHKDVDSGDLT